ncbi:hypothetical protein F4212_02745 [Candidatus Poribacteria bacterium]|nr:hypothetical protein [Candidatus Poribacteria bacterium]
MKRTIRLFLTAGLTLALAGQAVTATGQEMPSDLQPTLSMEDILKYKQWQQYQQNNPQPYFRPEYRQFPDYNMPYPIPGYRNSPNFPPGMVQDLMNSQQGGSFQDGWPWPDFEDIKNAICYKYDSCMKYCMSSVPKGFDNFNKCHEKCNGSKQAAKKS